MDSYTEIRNKIRAMTGQKTPLLLTERVESVDGETCSVGVGDNSGFAFRLCLFVFHPYRAHRNFVFLSAGVHTAIIRRHSVTLPAGDGVPDAALGCRP